MHLPPARRFSDAWTLDDDRQYRRVQGRLSTQQSKLFDRNKSVSRPQGLLEANANLRDKIVGHLLYLKQQGRLSPLPFAEEVDVGWVACWQALFVPGTATELPVARWMERLVRPLVAAMEPLWRVTELVNRGSDPSAALHRFTVEFIENGTWEPHQGHLGPCARTGEDVAVAMEDWQGTLGILLGSDLEFEPLRSGQLPDTAGIQHTEVVFPSGQLLVSDWFRHPAFTEAMGDEEDLLDSDAHRIAHTKALAALGVVSVWTTQSPRLFMEGNVLQAALVTEEEAEHGHRESVGDVATDLWAVSVVDRQTLEALLARTLPAEEVAAVVDEMLAEQAVVEISVAPGAYHLYFAGKPEAFAPHMDRLQADWTGVEKPVFVLADRCLEGTA